MLPPLSKTVNQRHPSYHSTEVQRGIPTLTRLQVGSKTTVTMDPEQPSQADPLLAPTPEDLAAVKVFPLIAALKKDVTDTIADTALSWDQLTASDVNFAIIRPLVIKYARLRNMAVVYACLVVRSYFLAQADANLAFTMLMTSRANLCELLALKLVSRFGTYSLSHVAVLTTAWSPLAGASPAVVEEVKDAISEHNLETAETALEMAITTKAKAFLAHPVMQQVINDIYSGSVVFSLHATRSFLADNYKPRPIQIYDVRKAPFLNHYRLRVPRYNAILDFLNFGFFLLAFVLCMSNQDKAEINFWEFIFIVLASAKVLVECTSAIEHGWYIYIANASNFRESFMMWNAFDFSFVVIFLVYLVLRLKGLRNHDQLSAVALDILACGGCILFPRLAFFAVTNHVIILSLQAMVVQFVVFIGTVTVCFSGLLFTLWVLARDQTVPHNHDPWTIKALAWYCVQIWIGNGYIMFTQAESFHPVFGPLLVTVFAIFFLISILSNTVAKIGSNANQEYMYQFAISTIEGVKNEALFSYQPPFNLLAFVILKPASWFLSPRALHRANVLLIKMTSFPQLVIIATYERYLKAAQRIRLSGKETAHSFVQKHIKNMPLLEALLGPSHNDIYDAILGVELDEDVDIFAEFDEGSFVDNQMHTREHSTLVDLDQPQGAVSTEPTPQPSSLRRRTRVASTHWPSPYPGTPNRAFLHSRAQSQALGADSNPKSEPSDKEHSNLATAGQALVDKPGTSPLRIVTSLSNGNRNSGMMSPLARLFHRSSVASSNAEHTVIAASAETNATLRKIEALLEDVKGLQVNKLRSEVQDIKERQTRIENLLVMITRGMRDDTARHDSY